MIKNQPNARFKMAIIGDGGVGKTTLINRYISGTFIKDYKMTIGVDFYTKSLTVADKLVSLKIWDFAGQNQNQFKNLLPNYMSGAMGVVFMYDTTRFLTLKHMDEWMKILKSGLDGEKINIPLILVGGKSDRVEDKSVALEYAQVVGKKYNFYESLECSSLTGQNIEYIFQSITLKMLQKSKNI